MINKTEENFMSFYLPIKALSINRAFQGRRFKTKECLLYCAEVKNATPKTRKVSGFIELHCEFYLKNWKKTDADNLIKLLVDCFVQVGIIDDDSKIMKYIIEKFPAKEDSMRISIKQIEVKKK